MEEEAMCHTSNIQVCPNIGQGHAAEADRQSGPQSQALGHQSYYSFYYAPDHQCDFYCETRRVPPLQMDAY